METEKQRLLLSILIGSRDLLAICAGIIRPSYFSPELRKGVKFALDYFGTYKDVPKIETIRAETGLVLEPVGQITKADIKYAANEVETFCRNRAVFEAIMSGPELLDKEDFGKLIEIMKDATSVSLSKDIGIDYFDDPASRLASTLSSEAKISTGWSDLDSLLGGGLSRQELILFAATSGGGKSMTMLNLGKNLLEQGLNGIYITLEMGEGSVSRRLDSMISSIGQSKLLSQVDRVAEVIEGAASKMGRFIIKRMPENRTNINTIRSFLQQLEQSSGFIPDFIIIDYVDIMGSTQALTDNMFINQKYTTEEIRSLGFDYNCIMISASQLGRSAHEADKLSQAHIQGGMSKINTCDYAVAIKQDELMRAQGEIYFEILKTRNSGGVGSRLLLSWNPVSLVISSLKKGPKLELSKTRAMPTPRENHGVLGLLET